MIKPADVDAYIAGFPPETQQVLEQVRSTIRAAVPQAQEVISYGMPAYKQEGMLIYFAGYKNHIGLYPTASGIEHFKKQIAGSGYKHARGSVQFPLDRPVPLKLIRAIAAFRLKENLQKAKAGKK